MNGSFSLSTILQVVSLVLTLFIIPMVKYITSRELKKLEASDAENKGMLENFIKAVNERFEKIEDSTRKEIDTIRQELNQFKAEAPIIYTLRDDSIRAYGTLERKLDKILEWLALMPKKGDKTDERD